MNKGDGEDLLNILYKIGLLTDYWVAVASAFEGNEGDDESVDDESVDDDDDSFIMLESDWDDELEFSTYFDFENEDEIELDSEGRIESRF